MPRRAGKLDLFSNSPLLQRYLQALGMPQIHGKAFNIRHLVNYPKHMLNEKKHGTPTHLPNGNKRRTYREILATNQQSSQKSRQSFETQVKQNNRELSQLQKDSRANLIRFSKLYDQIKFDKRVLREFSDIIKDSRSRQGGKVFVEKVREVQTALNGGAAAEEDGKQQQGNKRAPGTANSRKSGRSSISSAFSAR